MQDQLEMTVTISPVDVSKSLLIAIPDFGTGANSSGLRWSVSASLTNSTTLTFGNRYSNFTEWIMISWQVIEFY